MRLFLLHAAMIFSIQVVVLFAMAMRVGMRARASQAATKIDYDTDDYSWIWDVGSLQRTLVSVPQSFAEPDCILSSAAIEDISSDHTPHTS